MANVALRLPAVQQKTGLSKSSIYNRIKAGTFPRGFSLGGYARAWLENEIDDWIADRAAEPRTAARHPMPRRKNSAPKSAVTSAA